MSNVIPLFTSTGNTGTQTIPSQPADTYPVRVLDTGTSTTFADGRTGRLLWLGNWKHTAQVIQYDPWEKQGYQGDALVPQACYAVGFFVCADTRYPARPLVLHQAKSIDASIQGVRLIPRNWATNPADLIRLVEVIDSITHPSLNAFANAVLADPALAYPYVRIGASQIYHHNVPGGLLSHSLDVVDMALGLRIHRNPTERDLLIIGGLFHDLAKVRIYSPEGRYTDTGRTAHHDTLTPELVAPHLWMLDDNLADMVRHLLYRGNKQQCYPNSLLREALLHADALSAVKDSERQAFADRPQRHSLAKDPQERSWMRLVSGQSVLANNHLQRL